MGRQQRRERGAVLVELAVVTPFLLVLVLGIAELGLRTHSSQSIVGASRAAARVATSAGDDRLADYTALQALAGALDRYEPADVERIIIFDAGASDGSLPSGCDAAPQDDLCNHYTAADFAAVVGDFGESGGTCTAASPDEKWCPLDRETDQNAGADWLGVQVRVRHASLAPFLRDTTLVETTIMRLEPRFEP